MLLEREENLEDVIKDLEIIMNREKIKQDIQYKDLLKVFIEYTFINEKYKAIRKYIETMINKIFDEEGDDETMSHVTQLFDEALIKQKKEAKKEAGRERGKKRGKQEVAKAMKENKVSYKIISQCTGLKLEEIEEL